MSKGHSRLFKFTKGDFANFEIKYESPSKKKEVDIDFYVGSNGKVLAGKYKNYIGVSRRERLLKKAKNKKLKNAISELYRKGSYIGDGGTSSMIKLEKAMGFELNINDGHLKKANNYIINLSRIIKNENLSKSDLKLANELKKKLIKTVRGIKNDSK